MKLSTEKSLTIKKLVDTVKEKNAHFFKLFFDLRDPAFLKCSVILLGKDSRPCGFIEDLKIPTPEGWDLKIQSLTDPAGSIQSITDLAPKNTEYVECVFRSHEQIHERICIEFKDANDSLLGKTVCMLSVSSYGSRPIQETHQAYREFKTSDPAHHLSVDEIPPKHDQSNS